MVEPPVERDTAERRQHILRQVREVGHASVTRLSEALRVSEVTIRKDLRALEQEGAVVRIHGGAVLADHFTFDLPFEAQRARHADEKRRIGVAAAARVPDGATLILTTGTTTAEVARHLAGRKRLTVLTDSIRIAGDLYQRLDVEVLLLGGLLRPTTASVVGPHAEEMLRHYAVDTCFLAVDGYEVGHGLTTTGTLEAQLFRQMMQAAREVVVVADASKFGRRGLSRIVGLDAVDAWITDRRLDAAMRAHLEAEGVEVVAV